MNKKIITGLIVLLGVIAVLGLMSNSDTGVQLVKKHDMKQHKWGWFNKLKNKIRKAADQGCEESDAYEEQCDENGGVLCGENIAGRYECCASEDDCKDHSKSIWGYTKEWKTCENQILTGSCP